MDTPPTSTTRTARTADRVRRAARRNRFVVLPAAALAVATTAVTLVVAASDPVFGDLASVVVTVAVVLILSVLAATITVWAPDRVRPGGRLGVLVVLTAAYTATLMQMFAYTPAMTAAIAAVIPWALLGALFVLAGLIDTLTHV